jgi:hypothetical protein
MCLVKMSTTEVSNEVVAKVEGGNLTQNSTQEYDKVLEVTISNREKKMFWRIVGAIFIVATAITIYGVYVYSTTAKFAQAWITGGYWTWVQVTPPDSTFFIVGVALYPISALVAEIIMLAVSLIRAKRRQNK